MKINVKKIAVITAVLLVILIIVAACFLLGNPVLYAVSKSAAQDYLDQHYESTDYVIKDLLYSPKKGSYNAIVSSPSSIDTEFALVMNRFGGIEQNTYDYVVSNGFNTGLRLNYEYHDLVDEIIFSDDFPYNVTNGYGRLAFHSGEEGTFDFSKDTNSLIIDKQLSRGELNDIAASCGEFYLEISGQQFSEQTANEMATLLKNLCIENDVVFYNLTLNLETQNDNDISVVQYNFLYDDIV